MHNNDSVPRVPNGVEYDTGEKEDIPNNGSWIEDTSKGSSARIYNAAGECQEQGGEEPMYYWEHEMIEKKHGGWLEMVMECWFGTRTTMGLYLMVQN